MKRLLGCQAASVSYQKDGRMENQVNVFDTVSIINK